MAEKSTAISILIVDDVDEMRHLLEHVIQEIEGLRLSGSARNGFEARLEVSRRRPDLILLDEVLPGESGHDLLMEFAAQQLPVILITSLEHPSQIVPSGALGRMAKPGWQSVEEDKTRMKSFIFRHLTRSEA